jgi:4a-hydroxytetrahydrobiopterin dehydratase
VDTLTSQKCVACRRDSPSVTSEEVSLLMPQIPEWSLVEEGQIPRLTRHYRVKNFQEALDLTTRIGALAEGEGHHPRLVTEFGSLVVTWWTHKIRNLHKNDFIMAAKTDVIWTNWLD